MQKVYTGLPLSLPTQADLYYSAHRVTDPSSHLVVEMQTSSMYSNTDLLPQDGESEELY